MADAADTVRSGLALIEIGVKKLRDAGLVELADEVDRVVSQAVRDAWDEVLASQETNAVHAAAASVSAE